MSEDIMDEVNDADAGGVASRPLIASRSQLNALYVMAMGVWDRDLINLCTRAMDHGDAEANAQCTAVIVEDLCNDELSLTTVSAIAEMLGMQWGRPGPARVCVIAGGRRIHAVIDDRFSDDSGIYWRTEPDDGRDAVDGKWRSFADIEATLRAFGGAK